MMYRKEDDFHDMIFGSGLNAFEQNTPFVVGLAARTRLLLWVQEWFMDAREGTVPLIGKMSQKLADTIVRDRISTTPGVTAIPRYESYFTGRSLTITCWIDTVYGTTQLFNAEQIDFVEQR